MYLNIKQRTCSACVFLPISKPLIRIYTLQIFARRRSLVSNTVPNRLLLLGRTCISHCIQRRRMQRGLRLLPRPSRPPPLDRRNRPVRHLPILRRRIPHPRHASNALTLSQPQIHGLDISSRRRGHFGGFFVVL